MSHRTNLLIFVVLFVLTVSAGCGGSADVKLSAADNGKTVDAKVGGQIVIELEGNPSTGYNWEPKDLDTQMLQPIGEPEFKSSAPGLVGSAGTITLTFKSLKAGTTTLNLIYHRSWETDVAPLSTYTVTIVAK